MGANEIRNMAPCAFILAATDATDATLVNRVGVRSFERIAAGSYNVVPEQLLGAYVGDGTPGQFKIPANVQITNLRALTSVVVAGITPMDAAPGPGVVPGAIRINAYELDGETGTDDIFLQVNVFNYPTED